MAQLINFAIKALLVVLFKLSLYICKTIDYEDKSEAEEILNQILGFIEEREVKEDK